MDKCPVTRNWDSAREVISSHDVQFSDAVPCVPELEVRQKRPLAVFLLNITGMHCYLGLLEALAVIIAIE